MATLQELLQDLQNSNLAAAGQPNTKYNFQPGAGNVLRDGQAYIPVSALAPNGYKDWNTANQGLGGPNGGSYNALGLDFDSQRKLLAENQGQLGGDRPWWEDKVTADGLVPVSGPLGWKGNSFDYKTQPDWDSSLVNTAIPIGAAALAGGGLGGYFSGGGTLAGTGSTATGIDASTGLYAGESASSGAATNGSPGMWDWLDEIGYDPGAEGMYNAVSAADPYGGSAAWPDDSVTGGANGGEIPRSSPFDFQSLLKQYGTQALNLLKPTGAGPSGSQGRGILDQITGDPLGSAFNATPFLLALAEANRQQGITNPTLSRISGLADSAANNQTGLVASAVDPYNRQTMAGRDALLADQQARGVRGSSFGDQSLTSYDTMRGQGAGDLTAKATATSLGLQGGLLDNILKGQTQAATNRNMLLGAGLNASGKLFQPQSDPFGLKNLLGL